MTSNERIDMLAILRRTLADYSELPGNWPELELVAVNISTMKPAADETLFNEIETALAAPGGTGWVRFRSGLAWTESGSFGGFAKQGPPVMAEWTLDDHSSCRLRLDPDNPGHALIWACQERLLPEPGELAQDEFPFLREKAALLAHHARLENRQLAYNVFWGAEDDSDPHALSRLFDRFTGFEEIER